MNPIKSVLIHLLKSTGDVEWWKSDDAGAALVKTVTGSEVDVTSVVPGTGATDLGKAEDGAHTSGDVGVMSLGVRKDTPAALGADGDYVPYETDADGRVHVMEKNSTDLKTAVGEVQATPTEYTLLRRLKDLLTGIVLAAGTNLIGKVDHSITGITSGSKAVTMAGTAVKLVASSTPCKRVDIQGLYTNTSYVAVGGADVNATPATQKGLALSAGGMYSIACDDAFDLYVDSAVNGEGVAYNILT